MKLPLPVVGRYYKDVRRSISILMNLMLALTFLQAPFLHVHEHEETQRHPGGFFHSHFLHHHHLAASKSAEFSGLDPDDDAVYQQWFSATISDFIDSGLHPDVRVHLYTYLVIRAVS
jgi:hypothetical protein